MIVTIFGKPRAGKSTIVASIVETNRRKQVKYQKRISKSRLYKFLDARDEQKFFSFLKSRLYSKNFYDVVYSTDPTILNTVPIEYKDVGTFRPTWNSLFILEEAGIGIDSRQYKSLTTDSKRFAAMHGHQGVDVLVVSQTVDIDKAYRQRSQIMYIASKVGPFTLMRRISYSVDVDETTHDLVDAYAKVNPLRYVWELLCSTIKKDRIKHKLPLQRSRFIFRPRWYKYFNSFVDDYNYKNEDPAIKWLEEREAAAQI